MNKSNVLFGIVMGFDLALSFLLPIPILSNFASSWFMSFFLKIIGWKKMLQIYCVESVIILVRSFQAFGAVTSWYNMPFELSSMFCIAIVIIFLTWLPINALILTYITYWINKRIFKKWFKLIDNLR